MDIQKTKNGASLTIAVAGRIDTTTAPELEAQIRQSLDGVEELYLDLAQVEYVSSAGLRVLLSLQKVMNKQGRMVVQNVGSTVMEVFEVTGFCDFLTIE